MNACVRVTVWRALLTVVGVLLVATDIPRTGLVFNKKAQYPSVGTGIEMYWGPYEYPVIHLSAGYDTESATRPSSINASTNGDPIDSVGLWAYKYDTLSIASRSIARLFNLTAYPPCVLYIEPCASSELEPLTVFRMVDTLMTTVATRGAHQPGPLLIISKSHWVDRLHHVLYTFLTKNPEHRLHSIYYSATTHHRDRTRAWSPRQLCRSDASMPAQSLPFFCKDPISWKCDHPVHPTGQRRIPIWDHMSIRFDDLARRHPHLQLDFVLTVTSFTERTHSDRHVVPSVSYSTDPLEITTLIRGTQCASPSNCRPIFIDEYRYERIVIESDVDGWRAYLRSLRGFSQIYIWLRLALLLWGCYRAIIAERKSRHRRLVGLWLDVLRVALRIPTHTIVYGCWLPIVVYALAHHFDSCLVQTVDEFSWASVGGFFNFDPVEYVVRASIQMRNIWMLALVCKLAVYGLNSVTRDRLNAVHSARDGLLCLRGGWIGFVSWLTTYSLMRALHFRDTAVVSVLELPTNIPIRKARRAQALGSYTDYGLRFDLKCSLAACVVAAGIAWTVKALVRLTTGRATSVFIARSHYTPLSAGRLWLWSAAYTFWRFKLHSPTSASPVSGIQPFPSPPKQQSRPSFKSRTKDASAPASSCPVCSFPDSAVHWRATQGCPAHEPIFDIHARTTEIWSMIRLTNIALMTDPLALFRLYVVGRTLYLYRVHSSDSADEPYVVLLPTPPKDEDEDEEAPRAHWSAPVATRLEYVAEVRSCDVPWHVLINCG